MKDTTTKEFVIRVIVSVRRALLHGMQFFVAFGATVGVVVVVVTVLKQL